MQGGQVKGEGGKRGRQVRKEGEGGGPARVTRDGSDKVRRR